MQSADKQYWFLRNENKYRTLPLTQNLQDQDFTSSYQ